MTQLKRFNVDPDVIIPGVLRKFDLPDLERALGPRFRVDSAGARAAVSR
jgi:hypothetical protein